MMKKKIEINLFDYLDYRMFLNDFINHKKSSDRKYSFRYYSAKAGFSSTNFLNMAIQGKRNLSNNSILKIAKALRLNKQEQAYFENLVLMNQAADSSEKDFYYQRMLKAKPFSEARRIDQSGYDYFAKWYYPAIRELLDVVSQSSDAKSLAALLTPKISETMAQNAINALLDLGLIVKDVDTGNFTKTDLTLTTDKEVSSIQIANFHKAMMEKAEKSIEQFSPIERDISGVMLAIDASKMQEVKDKIDNFRKELIQLSNNWDRPNRVMYIQINAFPLSEIITEE